MRHRNYLGMVGLVVCVAGCENPMAPRLPEDSRRAVAVPGVNLQTGPSNQCRGAVVSEVASDWPWPQDKATFPPPPGAIARFIETFGPLGGFSSVRELQELFCAGEA